MNEIEFTASDAVREALDSIGRTEDIKFSPDNKRLVIAGITKNRLLVVDVEIEVSSASAIVSLTDYIEITSESLRKPHGISFLDEKTIVVANREGDVSILRLPASGTGERYFVLSPINEIRCASIHKVKTPSAVSARPIGDNLYEILVCNTYVHYVTRHIIDGNDDFRIKRSKLLLKKGIDVPDGVAVSYDSRWIAVANHGGNNVVLYENEPRLNENSEPTAILRAVMNPHGVGFSKDNKFILVASACLPFVHIYTRYGNSWNGLLNSMCLIQVMDEDLFLREKKGPEEGGPKGIDFTNDMKLLVITCEEKPIAFFNLGNILEGQIIDKDAHVLVRCISVARVIYKILSWNVMNFRCRVVVFLNRCRRISSKHDIK